MTARRRGDLGRDPAAWLLVAGFLAGLAHLFLTPPFEGFDETAHYSSVQQIADTGRIPVYGRDLLSEDVADYLTSAPAPAYAAINPADPTSHVSYAQAFASADSARAARAMIAERPRAARRYAPAGPANWQAQHPPLAYLLLAPVYHATKALDWKTHLFALRFFCFAVAMTGLAVGVLATRAYIGRARERSVYGLYAPAIMAAWPFYAPMFLPEMARLGNDSFCLLFAGLSWAALLGYLRADGARLKWAMLLGLALAMGALTKAFFLPAAAGTALLLLIREGLTLRATGGRDLKRAARALAPALAMGLVFLAVAAWWYVAKLADTGALSGANSMIAVKESAGAGLAENFSLVTFVRRLSTVYLTFMWAGTWSAVKLSYNAVAFLGLCFALVMGAYGAALIGQRRREAAAWAPLFVVAPVWLGLAYHVFAQLMVGDGGAGTGGWYLHMFASPLGFAYAIGAAALLRKTAGAVALAGALAYTLLFAAAAELHQLSVFTGCLAQDGAACAGKAGEIWRRLELVANPAMGALAFLLAAGAFCYAAYRAFQALRRKTA